MHARYIFYRLNKYFILKIIKYYTKVKYNLGRMNRYEYGRVVFI